MNRVLRTDSRIDNELILMDPLIERIIGSCDPIEIELSSDHFSSLASSIVGQQLSNKVAEVIWNRVVSLMEGELSPEKLLSIEDIEFRTIGISYAKIGYLKNLARAVFDNKIRLDNLEDVENTEIIETLTAVKGIGQMVISIK
jgi:DNA-3-methyladenine glycosylase II